MSSDGGPRREASTPTAREVRATIHDLSNALTRILTTAELIAGEVAHSEQAAQDARDVQAAAIESRDLVDRLRQQIEDLSSR